MTLSVKSKMRTQFIDITSEIKKSVGSSGVSQGLLMLYVPHTTAAITINESADPSVASDIMMVLNKVVPWKADYGHLEGNSPAHIKSTLVGASEVIAIENGSLVLGTWQGIFFCEFDGPRTRKVHMRLLKGEFI
ncbi:MAG: secondary thiamine-phosphate synthase enzyme YjbQ [Thermodesulfobacteriota bacterium]|nr:secondary thiamine-phosphate synthase enzyme YjbQ [Thermodesulfobacteriota bacterium]